MTKLTQEEKEIVKKYGEYFVNTGGNEIVEIIERNGVNYFNNPVAAELQGSCYSQLLLIKRLLKEKLLK